MKQVSKLHIIILITIAIISLFPIPVTCRVPGYSCAAPVRDSAGKVTRVQYSAQIEPLAIFLLELVVRKEIPLYYSDYTTENDI